MSNMTVKFIDKEYDIPKDILQYIDLLEFADDIKQQLMNSFVRELKKSSVGCIDDKDLSEEINRQVGKFISKLCDHDIYDRTVNDYLADNKGYELFSKVNQEALEKMKRIFIDKIDTYKEGVEDALYRKEASVTGMGFSVWSSSFIDHAIYAGMEYSTLKKQEKEASEQYQKELANLNSYIDSKYGAQEKEYISNVYMPNMDVALTVFSYELLDKYVADLIAINKFDKEALNYVYMSRSNELLDNLKLSDNKKAILQNAFIACPYNIAVYMNAMKYDLLDYDSFQTAKCFKQSQEIISFLKSNLGKVSYPKVLGVDEHCIELYTMFSEKDERSFLKDYTQQYAEGVVEEYARITRKLSDKNYGSTLLKEFNEDQIVKDDSISKKKANSIVATIVNNTNWSRLTGKYGHTDLFDKLKALSTEFDAFENKEEMDTFLKEKLFDCIEAARKIRAEQIIERRNEEERKAKELRERLEAEERQKQELKLKRKEDAKRILNKSKKVTVIATVIIAIVVAVIFAGITINKNVIVPANKYKEAVTLMEDGKYQDAYDIFLSLDDYKDSEKLLKECEAQIVDEKYNYAIQLMNDGDYESAITAFEEVIDYKESKERIAECKELIKEGKYNEAISLAEKGSYKEAADILLDLEDYKNAKELYAKYCFLGCEEGDLITFGNYEQDGDSDNGKEPIEWLVLNRDGKKALVISKYCIDEKPFNKSLSAVTWANCSLRKWLNDTFISNAFSSDEKSKIVSSKLSNVGSDTTDKVFLLSESEADKYFSSDADRTAVATEAVDTSYCPWFLRTTGNVSNVAYVDDDGELGYYENVDRNWCIRPAMWVNITE